MCHVKHKKMSFVGHIAKNTFNTVFENLSEDLGAEVGNVKIGIYYDEKGNQKFCSYNDGVYQKDIELDDYFGSGFDFSGGTEIIKSTIASAGAGYSAELKAKISDIRIIMGYRKKQLPIAVLMNGGEKVRMIDIEKEFLK